MSTPEYRLVPSNSPTTLVRIGRGLRLKEGESLPAGPCEIFVSPEMRALDEQIARTLRNDPGKD